MKGIKEIPTGKITFNVEKLDLTPKIERKPEKEDSKKVKVFENAKKS